MLKLKDKDITSYCTPDPLRLKWIRLDEQLARYVATFNMNNFEEYLNCLSHIMFFKYC